MTPRAPALAPDDRRAALVDVATATILSDGEVPSTTRLAAAAGIAEGTIYRAFPSKEALLDAVVDQAFCPVPVLVALDEIDATLDLEPRLVAAVDVLQRRVKEFMALLMTMRMRGRPGISRDHAVCVQAGRHRPLAPDAVDDTCDPPGRFGRGVADTAIDDAVTALVAPDADDLRIEPAELTRLARLLTLGGSHPSLSPGDPLTPTEVVAVLLHGVVRLNDGVGGGNA